VFDQGVTGFSLFVMLIGGALWRLIAGGARAHPAAPFLASALVGFLAVGVFDSLLDVPRVAFLFYLVVFLSLVLRNEAPRANRISPEMTSREVNADSASRLAAPRERPRISES